MEYDWKLLLTIYSVIDIAQVFIYSNHYKIDVKILKK